MDETVLIVKKRGRKTEVKVTSKNRSYYKQKDFTRVVNITNYKDLALFFHDLDTLWSAPVDKAIGQYKEDKSTGWPF